MSRIMMIEFLSRGARLGYLAETLTLGCVDDTTIIWTILSVVCGFRCVWDSNPEMWNASPK